MASTRNRAKEAFETMTTSIMAVAAVVIVWHLVTAPAGTKTSSAAPPVFENISSRRLSTGLANGATKGEPTSPLVLIEFSDFECPFCARHEIQTLPSIEKHFVATGRVQYVVRNFPLPKIHNFAITSANAAECARLQGKYWDLRAVIFAKHRQLSELDWSGVAADIGIAKPEFELCREKSGNDFIELDQREGERLGVTSTPTFFIGRRSSRDSVALVARLRGAAPYEVFEKGLTSALNELD